MNTSLNLFRQINPKPALHKQLADIGHLYELEDGTTWVDDDAVRDKALNDEITGWGDAKGHWVPGCTVGWGIFDSDFNKLGFYRDLNRAQTAMVRAKPVIVTEFDLEQEDQPVEITKGGATMTTEVLPATARKKPFEA